MVAGIAAFRQKSIVPLLVLWRYNVTTGVTYELVAIDYDTGMMNRQRLETI